MNAKLKKHFGTDPIVWVAAWGISKLRKRAGKFAGSICGESLYYDKWHERAMSREAAEKLSGLGVNLVVLPFSIGGDEKAEKQERDDFEKMTGYLHEFNIVSLPYVQYQNILQESSVFPNTVWAKRLDGSRAQYNYWRRTACQSSREFIDYVKGLISDAAKRGGDGVWIDNNYLKPCSCDQCRQGFKSYLTTNRQDLLEELYLENFDNIEMPSDLNYSSDPIAQALIDFNCERNLKIHRELKSHLESISPYALFGSNPALYRGSSHTANGVDFKALIELNDLMYLENKFFPGKTKGQTTGNYHGYVACDSLGSTAIPGAWKREDFDSTGKVEKTGMPETKEDIQKVLFEAATFNGSLGMLWAVRSRPRYMCDSEEDLMTMYFEHPQIYKAMKSTIDFLKPLPIFGERKNIANIAVMYHKESLKLNFDASFASLHSTEELLLQAGMPYNVVFSENLEESIKKHKLLILPEAALLSEPEARSLENYVEKGGRLLVIGSPGLFNEKCRPRKDYILKKLLNASSFDKSGEIIINTSGKGKTAYCPSEGLTEIPIRKMMSKNPNMRLPKWTERKGGLLNALDELLGNDRQIIVEGGNSPAISLSMTEEGKCAIQLFSYDAEPQETELTIKANLALLDGKRRAKWITPGAEESSLEPEADSGQCAKFVLPGFVNYGLLLI